MGWGMCRKFEWDENKNRANQSKHGVDFDTASYVFDDPNFLSEQDRVVDGEERWQTIGLVGRLPDPDGCPHPQGKRRN